MKAGRQDVMSVDEVISGLEALDGSYKRAEIDWALEHRDEVTPRLITILDKVLADPQHFARRLEYRGHIYAVMILGHFGIVEAHEKIVELLSLPDDVLDGLFGDIVPENMPVILLRTCGGSIAAIKQIVENKDASPSARAAAAQAVAFAVAAGFIRRGAALSILGNVFASTYADDEGLPSMIAAHMAELCPEEWMDEITEAFQNEVIDPLLVEPDTFEAALERGIEGCLTDLQAKLEAESLDDLHAKMSWWAIYDQPTYFEPSDEAAEGTASDLQEDNDDTDEVSADDPKPEREEWLANYVSLPQQDRGDFIAQLLKSPVPGGSVEGSEEREALSDILIERLSAWQSDKKHDRVLEIAGLIQTHNPYILDDSFEYIDPKVIDILLFNGRADLLDLERFKLNPVQSIDQLIPVLDKLAFYGLTDTVKDVSQHAYPLVKDNPRLVDGAAYPFVSILFMLKWQQVYEKMLKGEPVHRNTIIDYLSEYDYVFYASL